MRVTCKISKASNRYKHTEIKPKSKFYSDINIYSDNIILSIKSITVVINVVNFSCCFIDQNTTYISITKTC